MTLCISSDWQLDDQPINQYRHDFQKQLRSIIKEHKVDCLLLLGDLTEEKDHHGAALVNKVVDHLDKLRALCKVIVVQGNHDYVDATMPFYQFTRHMAGISWVSRPLTSDDHAAPVELAPLGKVLLLPHTTNHKKDWAGLKLKAFDWVFTHMTFQGVHAAPGVQLRGIPTDIFGGARVISGDIHVPQIINGSRVEYVGAPYTVDFGDNYRPRVLLIEGDRVRSVPVNGPQKRLLYIAALGNWLEHLQQTLIPHHKVHVGDILKIRVGITSEQRAKWAEIKARVRAWGEEQGYIIHIVQPVLGEQAKKGKTRPQHTHQTDEALLASYARRNGIDKLTLKAGTILMRKA